MWTNGFGNPGNFQNFNPEGFQQMAFGGIPPQAQQFYSQQGMMQMNEPIDDDPMDGEYQPELSFANQRSFMQNQNIGASFSSPPFMNDQATQPAAVVSPRAPTQMNARAAELKAELLKRKGERTPPVLGTVAAAKQAAHPESFEHTASNSQKPTDDKREQDLNELISQYSVPKATIGTTVKQEKKTTTGPNIDQIPVDPNSANSLAAVSKSTKPVNKSKSQIIETQAHALASRHASNGSVSDGEILEDTVQSRAPASIQAKEIQAREKTSRPEEPLSRTSREGQNVKPQYPRPREEPRYRSPSSSRQTSALNGRDDRREEADRMERRKYAADLVTYDGNHHTESDRQLHPRRGSRDEEKRQMQDNGALARTEPNKIVRPSEPPSLQDILPHDEDLREWLEITGYHNETYRNKILNRRRAIAALDAQRDKLLAEMAAEERGGVLPSMLPPPIPNKVGSRVESTSTASATEPQRASNKRPYSEVQDAKDAPNTEKIARVEERSLPSRSKDEEDPEIRRPRSSGLDSGRRFSPVRHEGSEPSRQRFEGRPRSRERDVSPGRRAYDSRPPPRSRGYESDSYFNRDNTNERRQVEYHGTYRGKAFDPDYHSRGGGGVGRGRGRGRARGESRDSRDYQPGGSEYKNDSLFGSRIANGRPYRNTNGFDRGGRGDTRYFIVKSFNEENVLKCIQDSVWTTQVQNGPVFKEAFETCKNVILVFSINKSRAFQGYARMESLPGSVEVPDWQRAINWESAGAFKVKWLVICATRFHRVGHLKNAYNENQAVLIGKDGQEIEENCGAGLIELIDEEADQILGRRRIKSEERDWEDHY